MWLAKLPFRRKLALIVGVPSVVVLFGSLLALTRVSSTYRRSYVLEEANASSFSLIQAAAAQAKERGFASAALSDPSAQTARQAIDTLRESGHRFFDDALVEAQNALHGNTVLATAHLRLQEARHNHDHKRMEIDGALAHGVAVDPGDARFWR